jgi:hypothetical protein
MYCTYKAYQQSKRELKNFNGFGFGFGLGVLMQLKTSVQWIYSEQTFIYFLLYEGLLRLASGVSLSLQRLAQYPGIR